MRAPVDTEHRGIIARRTGELAWLVQIGVLSSPFTTLATTPRWDYPQPEGEAWTFGSLQWRALSAH